MKTTLLTFGICMACFISKGGKVNPDSLKSVYEKETIYLEVSNWKGNMYTRNGETKKTGLFGEKLNKEFENSPDAKKEIALGKHHLKRTFGTIVGGAAVAV